MRNDDNKKEKEAPQDNGKECYTGMLINNWFLVLCTVGFVLTVVILLLDSSSFEGGWIISIIISSIVYLLGILYMLWMLIRRHVYIGLHDRSHSASRKEDIDQTQPASKKEDVDHTHHASQNTDIDYRRCVRANYKIALYIFAVGSLLLVVGLSMAVYQRSAPSAVSGMNIDTRLDDIEGQLKTIPLTTKEITRISIKNIVEGIKNDIDQQRSTSPGPGLADLTSALYAVVMLSRMAAALGLEVNISPTIDDINFQFRKVVNQKITNETNKVIKLKTNKLYEELKKIRNQLQRVVDKMVTDETAKEIREETVRINEVLENIRKLLEEEKPSDDRSVNVTQTWLYPVYFDFASAELTTATRYQLRRLISQVNGKTISTIKLRGYADRSGADNYNQRLSEKRAMAVRDELVVLGLPEEKIRYQGYGERGIPVPTGDNHAEAANRVVELYVEAIQ